MTNRDSLFRSRDIPLPTKIPIVKAVGFFPVVMYGCESWTIKEAEPSIVDAFKLWCWRRLLSGSPALQTDSLLIESPGKPIESEFWNIMK